MEAREGLERVDTGGAGGGREGRNDVIIFSLKYKKIPKEKSILKRSFK